MREYLQDMLATTENSAMLVENQELEDYPCNQVFWYKKWLGWLIRKILSQSWIQGLPKTALGQEKQGWVWQGTYSKQDWGDWVEEWVRLLKWGWKFASCKIKSAGLYGAVLLIHHKMASGKATFGIVENCKTSKHPEESCKMAWDRMVVTYALKTTLSLLKLKKKFEVGKIKNVKNIQKVGSAIWKGRELKLS